MAQTKQKYRFDLQMDGFPKVKDDQPRLEQLVAAGADYVVVSASDYKSILWSPVSVAMVNDESINAAKQFYSELFKRGTLVWSRDQCPVPYLQPGLEIYRVPRSGEGAKSPEIGRE
jgi:hypothetical protein